MYEVYFQALNWQHTSIGSNNDLAPKRRQAIIWTSGGLVYWRIYASTSLNDLYDRPSGMRCLGDLKDCG